jgi:hypothetical protein
MNKKNLHERRDAVIDLYSEGRSQQEIARKLRISQPTVHRDIQFERERIRNRSQTWLEEQLPFEHNACTVGLNKILRYAWDLVNNYNSVGGPEFIDPDKHKMIMDALDLAKDCYTMKIKLLGDDKAIKHFVDFYTENKSSAAARAQEQAIAEALELERSKSDRVF